MKLIPDGKPHNITAKGITHVGECTRKDIQRSKKEERK